MGYVSGRGGVGGGTHTGLVGVQATLNALHDGRGTKAHGTAEHGSEIKCLAENAAQDTGDHIQIHHHDHQGHQDIQHTHDRDQNAGNLDDPLAAAQYTDGHQDGQDHAAHYGHNAVLFAAQGKGAGTGVEVIAGKAANQVVGGQHIETTGIGGDEGDGEDNAQHPALKSRLNVVGRTTIAAALRVLFLIDLGQRALYKGSRASHNGDQPHPEHGAIAADGDGIGHTYNISGTHAAGCGYHQRLKCGNRVLIPRLFSYHANRLRQQAQLDKLAPEGEVQAYAQQHDDQQVTVHETADLTD